MKRYRPVVGACGPSSHRIDYEERADGEFVRHLDLFELATRLDSVASVLRSLNLGEQVDACADSLDAIVKEMDGKWVTEVHIEIGR